LVIASERASLRANGRHGKRRGVIASEAKQSNGRGANAEAWIASSLTLLAMTGHRATLSHEGRGKDDADGRGNRARGVQPIEEVRLSRKSSEDLSPEEWQARFNAAAAAAQREYCNIFALWRDCANGLCRKVRACRGDQHACLRRGICTVPYEIQHEARAHVIAATPADADIFERTARQFSPAEFYL